MADIQQNLRVGVMGCVASAFPIALAMAVAVSIEKGLEQFFSAFLFWLFMAIVFNLAISGTVGVLLVYLLGRIGIANVYTCSLLGAIIGVVVAYSIVGNLSTPLVLAGLAWGGFAAMAFWLASSRLKEIF